MCKCHVQCVKKLECHNVHVCVYLWVRYCLCFHGKLQAELKLAEKRSSQPSAELIQLQREVERLKVSKSAFRDIIHVCTLFFLRRIMLNLCC